MAKKYESKWNVEDLTDREVCDAIRYLEPESRCEKKRNNDEGAFVICLCVVILLLGFSGFMWLYSR